VTCPALLYFSTLSYQQQDFWRREREMQRKEVTANKMCFDFPYNFCLKHLILRTEPDMIKNVTVHKVPVNLI
jgi:hypothetical protein